MYLRRKLNQEGGFTIAEIIVAGFILAFALVPIVRMFDVSFSGIRAFEDIQNSVGGARAAVEEIRSLPFYEPYNATFGDVDIDDHFWGSRSPENTNPGASTPDWESIPEVEFYAYGAFPAYESYRIGVKLAYLSDDTGVSPMLDGWGPKTAGIDRPKDADNESIHLLLVQVNAYWMDGAEERAYTLESVVTDTEAIYNLGISSITVTGPASIQDFDEDGMVRNENAAAHWSSPNVDVLVEIKGWGFNPDLAANLTASIVRDKNNDIPITLSFKSTDTLRGTMKLYNTGTDVAGEPDWFPRAAVGYWSVKVKQETILSTYLYQGFTVQYPKPVISDFGNAADMSKTGLNSADAASLRIVGGPFVNQVKTPAARLLRYGPSGEILDQINGTNIVLTVPGGSYGYALSPNCTITATFDLTQGQPGEYHMVVVNTDEPTLIGHVASDPSAAVYTIVEVFPEISDVYVYGISPRYRSGYPNIGNPRTLVIEGQYFNQAGIPPYVDVYLCSDVVASAPSGTVIQGNVLSVVSHNTIVATFDLTGQPLGNYKVFVRNRNDSRAGWTAGAPFSIITFAPSISAFTATSDGFYENYYDVPSVITGSCLDVATGVSITNGTVEYDVTGESTVVSDMSIDVNLNLIDCNNTQTWNVRVYFSGGSPSQADYTFDVVLGPAKIIAQNNYGDTRAALYIWRQDGSYRYETTSTRAYARYNRTARFYVRGKGFPLAVNGQTTLRIWKGAWSLSGNYDCTTDRNNKIVRITSATWSMTNTTGDCGISVQRVGDASVDSYSTRWYLRTTY